MATANKTVRVTSKKSCKGSKSQIAMSSGKTNRSTSTYVVKSSCLAYKNVVKVAARDYSTSYEVSKEEACEIKA